MPEFRSGAESWRLTLGPVYSVGMNVFQKYRHTQIIEMRPYVLDEPIKQIRVPAQDRENGHPKVGDMIARSQQSPDDLWLVASPYFVCSFELVE